MTLGLGLELGVAKDAQLRLQSSAGVSVNMAGWSLSFMVKRRREAPDRTAIIHRTTGDGITVSGTFNVDPALNAQVAHAPITRLDTVVLAPGTYWYEWKRTDAGFEAVLDSGPLLLTRGVHDP